MIVLKKVGEEIVGVITCDGMFCDQPDQPFTRRWPWPEARGVSHEALALALRAEAARSGWTHPTIDGHEFDHCPECSR